MTRQVYDLMITRIIKIFLSSMKLEETVTGMDETLKYGCHIGSERKS